LPRCSIASRSSERFRAAVISRREWLTVGGSAVAAGAAGFAFNAWRTAPGRASPADTEGLLALRLPDLDNRLQTIADWKGKVVVVNFWATWCGPCRDEIPLFVKLQSQYAARGLQFIGIAIDRPEKVRPFAREFGMNFPILIGGFDTLELGRKIGNKAGVLPFTVVLGRDGRIVATAVGAAKPEKFEPLLKSLL
jgi:thiol-disulfide isomerase/thioredoxin